MMKRNIRVSLVIPAYNEERQIRACLQAVARQTVAPAEVIVVDNSSSDRTAMLARSFSFVRVVRCRRRGIAWARDAGFNAARGDVIARLDADGLPDPHWVETIQRLFANDPQLDAVTGAISYYDIACQQAVARLELFFRRYLARHMEARGRMFLYGGNMAMRREAWRSVRRRLCHVGAFHEDLDLAAHMAGVNQVRFSADLRVTTSARRIETDVRDFTHYVLAAPRTYAAHDILTARWHVGLVLAATVVCYPALRLMHRSYNPATRRFSLRSLTRSAYEQRVSPIAD